MNEAQKIIDTLDKIGETAYNCIKAENNSNEVYAFYLGTINVVTSILHAWSENEEELQGGGICLNYDKVKEKFEKQRAILKKEQEEHETLKNQISIEELFPKIIEMLDKYFEDKKSKTKPKKD